jgi:hypothetical protein
VKYDDASTAGVSTESESYRPGVTRVTRYMRNRNDCPGIIQNTARNELN